ncbi:MAG: hypothetical protein JO023_19150 [Chloroflexi bacterium]|nr:hypothetical protein [Chloroflexota bacterium]
MAIAAVLGGAILLASGSSGGSGGSTGGAQTTPNLFGSGHARACVTSRAAATASAASAVRAQVSASAPVAVQERAQFGGQTVTASLSENVVEQAVVSRPVEVRRTALAARSACARGGTADAARGAALTRAYKDARAAAHNLAQTQAASELKSVVAKLMPSTLAQARQLAASKAHAAAAAARPALAQQALAEARARARAAAAAG